jgi:hypothetical protein
MRWSTLTATAAALAFLLASLPADAQTRKRVRQEVDGLPGVKQYPTRITVRRARTYLDPGTEVLPMSRSYTDYAVPPNYSPMGVASGVATPAGWQNPHWPLPGPMEAGSFRNFYGW